MRQTFRITVMLPPRRKGETTRFPVVYAGDANLTFDMLKGISWLLQSAGTVPRFILVGIGYPGASPMAGALLRAREFTFAGYPRLKVPRHTAFEGALRAPGAGKDFEGGAEFVRFLRDELFPFVEGRYAARSGDRTYFGHSAAGSFGLFALLTAQNLFRNYLISSPGLAYDGTSSAGVEYEGYDFMSRRLAAVRKSGRAFRNKALFMSVGSEEELEPELSNWKMVSSFRAFLSALGEARLRGLKVDSEVFAGENHASVWPIAFVRGLRTVLAPRT